MRDQRLKPRYGSLPGLAPPPGRLAALYRQVGHAGTHPLLPGAVVGGHAAFEWLDGRQFLILRWHYDHPEIPDAIAIIGVTDEQLSMRYFDHRGVYRVYAVSLEEDQWRFWREVPGFSQRFTSVLSDFDSTAPASKGEAVYIHATARVIPDDELDAVCPEAFRTTAGARPFTSDELRGGALWLYVAHARSCEVHVTAYHPAHGRGIDTRHQADPTSAG